MFNPVLIAAPAEEPITVAQLKKHSRVTSSAEDDICATMIKAARMWCEAYAKRVFVTQTWDFFLDNCFPSSEIPLPKPRLQSVTHIKYVDTAGVLQTLDSSKYQVSVAGIIGRIAPAFDEVWPTTRAVLDAVQIRAVCGYGNAAAVPDNIVQAVYLLAAHFYQNREGIIVGSGIDAKEIPLGIRSLLDSGDKLFA